ncbi:zinc ribbon domain-containing protein [Kallotenue papyrolyticum]|uniref:zinc ribbon domain-containing protein n=1 Tax=Kallotenue papyrolyticum TaxID=1325125 RepID=UPI0004B737B4|nr:zinc ribbon domain-containing protein [Kallotenue papyrolyticum]
MICPACQHVIPDDARFCIFCAAPIAPPEPKPGPATGPTRRLGSPSVPVMEPAPVAPAPVAPAPQPTRAWPSGSTVFWIGLLLLFVTGWWWPGMLILLGMSSFASEARRGRQQAAWQQLIFWGGLGLLFVTDWFWPGVLLWLGLLALIKPPSS